MLKISHKILISCILALSIGITGCSKYEDGPNISLLTKTQRITGNWEVEKWVPFGETNAINMGSNIELEFDEDGDWDMRRVDLGSVPPTQERGEWEFSNDKQEIEIEIYVSPAHPLGASAKFEITRLTNKELEGVLSYIGVAGTTKIEAEKD